ncbi:MAG: hypothetical protein QOJ81_1160 [Chloroflexota bacterium]|nr:hypothetical protein [Chloroflexota bacterium]
MIALALIIVIVVLAAVAESFGSDSRDYEPRTSLGDIR